MAKKKGNEKKQVRKEKVRKIYLYAIAGLAIFVLAATALIVDGPKKEVAKGEKTPQYKEGEIIIKLKDEAENNLKNKENPAPTDTGISSLNSLDQKNQVSEIKPVIAEADKIPAEAKKEGAKELEQIYQLKVPEGKDEQAVADSYKGDPNIEYAEPNLKVEIDNTPNDPYFSSSDSWGQGFDDLYGLKKINAASAWDINQGSENVVVAVIDTGVDYTHEDLAANMWVNNDEIPGNNIDDDNNGYIDDVYGYDFYNDDGDPKDDHGHGSHCSGTISGVGNNGQGVVGVNWRAKIMAVKFLSQGGSGYTSDAISGVYYAVNNGAKVLSNSWGGWGRSSSLQTAINWAHERGVVFVAAAGNSNADAYDFSPAGLDNVIAVSATDNNDAKASFSNYGNVIDVAAPGVSILSVRATGTSMCSQFDKYCVASGTSMATPHVSGLAALVWARNPAADNNLVESIIKSNADDLGSPGFDTTYGYGRINAYKALSFNLARPNHTLIKTASSNNVYYLDNNVKKHIPNVAVYENRFRSWSEIVTVSDYEMNQYSTGDDLRYQDGTLAKNRADKHIYVMDGGVKRLIPNWSSFVNLNYSLDGVVISDVINSHPTGADISDTSTHVSGSLIKNASSRRTYLLENGNKRHIPDWSVFTSNFEAYRIVTISDSEFNSYGNGSNVIYRDGSLVRRDGLDPVYLIENSLRRPIADDMTLSAYGYNDESVISANPLMVTPIAEGAELSL